MLRDGVEDLIVPPLRSGGIMLSYQCGQSCRHCNYRCGPDAEGWMTEECLETTMAFLARERKLVDVHLAGGEATLRPDLAARAIALAVRHKVRLSYLETNGQYAVSVDAAKQVLEPLKAAGLQCVLVSISPYHNEFIPLRRMLNCLEAAVEVFGQDGVFPWLSHFIPMLAAMDPEVPHTLEEFFEANGMEAGDGQLLSLFPLSPGGRVTERLRDLFPKQPAEAFRGGHCLDILTDVSHFHIDPNGYVFTGQCPGIVAGTVGDCHGIKDWEKNRIFATLAFGGPYALMEMAREECGFSPDALGYVSPCDLCLQTRTALVRHNPGKYDELQPSIFYRA